MKYLILIILAIFVLAGNSCIDCTKGSDKIISVKRSGPETPFSEVECNGDFDFYILQDTLCSVSVEGDDNIVPYVHTSITNNRLKITQSLNCISSSHVSVYIHLQFFDSLDFNGSGYVECDNISNETINAQLSGSGAIDFRNLNVYTASMDISGSGEISVEGEAHNGYLGISGSGMIKAFKFYVDYSTASISGSGDIYTFFYKSLSAEISGSGSVFYKGDPNNVSASVTGSGRVVNNN
jgi:hypothetical protein